MLTPACPGAPSNMCYLPPRIQAPCPDYTPRKTGVATYNFPGTLYEALNQYTKLDFPRSHVLISFLWGSMDHGIVRGKQAVNRITRHSGASEDPMQDPL